MKKLFKYIFVSVLIFASGSGWAQSDYTLYSIGFIGGTKKVPSGGATGNVSYSTSHVGSTSKYETVVTNDAQVLTGFPYSVLYFKKVFDKPLFVSKGYFAEYVQLNWNVVNQAGSIKKFKVYRKVLGEPGDSLLVATVPADNSSWKDEFAERGIIYQYTLFAEGLSDQLRLPFINILQGIGFALPTGRASGRVAFEGGTAVEGVAVLAETEGSLSGKSLNLNGTSSYLSVPHFPEDKELELRAGFTFQAWCKRTGANKGIIFSKGNQYDLSVEIDKVTFKVNNATVVLPFISPVDTFFHVTAVYKPGANLSLYVHVNDERIDSAKVAAGTQPVAAEDNIFFGKNNSGDYFEGNLDEIRLWSRVLTYAEIHRDYSRYINGTEQNLVGYWRMNEGVGTQFYDFSRKGFSFNENHAFIINAQWSSVTPLISQLAFRGVTDASGNYMITGFPYETDGSLYKFTPTFGAHGFDPNQQIRLISDGTNVINELNFKDISSFAVSGTVKYKNTNFPVEGVSILVDGKPATNKDGQLILTDNLGRFALNVAIGKHSLKLQLNGHTFDDEGRFPAPTASVPIPTFDFQKPVAGIEFLDATLVKVAGRVVGGPVEAEKLLGFGKSKNNLGNATINLTTEKGYDISLGAFNKTYTEEHFTSTADFGLTNVALHPDPVTGEYVAYLLPEKYKVTGVTAGSYIYDANFNVTVNLKETIKSNEVLKDTLAVSVKGIALPYPPYNASKYDVIQTITSGDSTYKIGVDTFTFQLRKDFIYRTSPTISITNKNGEELFGDQSFVFEDKVNNVKETIPLIQNGNYTFGHPVFNDRTSYSMYVDLYEEYTNSNSGLTSKVPVIDGRIEVVNNLSTFTDPKSLDLDDKGKAVYTFTGGLPEINKDNLNPGNSYTKTINITAFSGNNESIQTIWRQNDPLRGFLFGGMPVGNNFVTTGPTQVITILRDPPGSSSNAYLESGESHSNSTTWSLEDKFSQEGEISFKLGQTVKIFAGVGVGTITETEYDNEVNIGWSSEETWASDNEKKTTITTTKRWETSDGGDYVGDRADVFVGHATSIVYGRSSIVEILPSASCTNCIPGAFTATSGSYSIGLKDGLRLNPEVSTGFMHTQGHIEDVIIPDLRKLRNSFLTYSANPSAVTPNTVTSPSDDECTKKAIYVSLVPLTDEVKYGSSNSDTLIWGTQAIRSNADLGNGPSYKIVAATGCDAFYTKDTIQYFNQQITDWLYWLERNEEEKVNATEEAENLAFDAGAKYEKSIAVEISETSTQSYEWSVNPSVAVKLGFSFNKFGMDVSGKLSYGHTKNSGSGSETGNTTTYGYTLAESESTDYYSVNVRKPHDGFGPVFRINGGVTSCPYQGEYATKYYKPGGKSVVLSAATVAVDAPLLEVEQPISADIASNRPAQFNLLLKNNSGINADRWYTLTVDDNTNPFGATLEIDGAPISNGRTFLVKAGETLQKTLKVRMGRPDVMTYEDLRLLLSSQCDDISDDVLVSAYFIPGCSDITLEVPKQNWVMNTNNTPKDTLLTKISGYNLTYNNFKQIVFQYKPSGSSLWTTDMVFYNPNSVTPLQYAAAQEPKQWITGPSILYYWDMHSQPDRKYDIRAKSICELGPGSFVETPTEIISGIKDVKRPLVFGSPQPADGVVSAGDEISVQFDETIEASLLTPFNFSVQAVLNGYQINHNTSVDFDGVNDEVKMNDGLNLNKSFTIEFWAKRNEAGKRQTVFSKGAINTDLIEIGFTEADLMFVKFAQQEIVTANAYPDTDWYHYAVVYDATTKKVSAFRNDKFILENVAVNSAFSGTGAITLGKSIINGSEPFKGNLHELRIWNKALQMGDVYAKMSASLSGGEIGLVGYWPFDEANGTLAHDKARFRHATINASWLVVPKGKGYSFDGVDDYLELNTGSTVIISEETDFTVEFWFKGATGQSNATIFSSGKGDGSDLLNGGSWSIGFSSGKLQLASKGVYYTVDNGVNLLNDNWHHFAVSVNRKGNTNVFIDGELAKSQTSIGFGPLYGAKMWLGARGFKTGFATTQFDQYFKGDIDEFRVWNLSKKQNQIELAKDAKLNGDELGLVAYYPFEFYTTSLGIKTQTPTLNDQWVNPYGANGGSAVAFGGSTYSTVTPNIKDSRPLQKVDFDWVVNDDKIIITPSPSMAAAIEKTLLEITVSNVQDKFENRIASPITWTAFVDKNQLKWGDDQITLEKTLYQPLQFTVDIVNKGGTQQNFVINNLPSWLKASPQSGIISALSSIQVTFTVDEGLNTGVYQEDIYLKSDFGFDEKLIVSLRNFTPVPSDWTVNPDNYQYSMNVDGQIKMQGKISNNPFDYLAVFVGNECRGVAKLQYVEAFDNYQAFLTLYSNSLGGENLDFKFWNANEGQVYTKVTPIFTFVANSVHGSPSNPIIFESVDNLLENKVDLPKGWKWISFNLYSSDMKEVNKTVKLNGSEGDLVKSKLYYDAFDITKGWIGTITSNGGLNNKEMYKVSMTNPKVFTYSGKFPDVDTLPIAIGSGWNWIGFISRFNMTVNEALANLNPSAGDLIKGQHNFAVYEPSMGWIGNLTYLKPGEGYMFKAQTAGTLVYPKISQLNGKLAADDDDIANNGVWEINPYEFSDNMSVIAAVLLGNGASVQENDLLGAFVDGVCRGVAKPIFNPLTNEYNFFLSVNGNVSYSNIKFRYYSSSESREYTANENISYHSNALKGASDSPFVLTVDGIGSNGVALYPNPFSKEIGINVKLSEDSEVKMNITDLAGKAIKSFDGNDASAGVVNLKWDGKDGGGASVSSGVYLLQVTINGELSTYKIVKY